MRTGIGRCFGTFGELLQGALPSGKEFLVTLPISRYSTVKFTVLPRSKHIHVFPAYKEKSRRLAENLMQMFDLSVGGTLHIYSELPEGKGYASSSADMVATAWAIRSALGIYISEASLAQAMSTVEPSDGVMYQGIVSYYHREGALRKFLGTLPSLTIVALDEGSQIDTIEFNKQAKSVGWVKRMEYETLLGDIEQAVINCDLLSMGEISTRSAILSQEILPKSYLDVLLDVRRRYNALGIIAAHSGTLLGVLLDPGSPDYFGKLPAITTELRQHSPDVIVYHTRDFRKL